MAQASGKTAGKSTAKKPGVFTGMGRYLKEVRTELRRVTWPNGAEVRNSTVVVVATLTFFIVFTLIVDSISSFVFINWLAGIGR